MAFLMFLAFPFFRNMKLVRNGNTGEQFIPGTTVIHPVFRIDFFAL